MNTEGHAILSHRQYHMLWGKSLAEVEEWLKAEAKA